MGWDRTLSWAQDEKETGSIKGFRRGEMDEKCLYHGSNRKSHTDGPSFLPPWRCLSSPLYSKHYFGFPGHHFFRCFPWDEKKSNKFTLTGNKKGNSEELICLPHFPLALLLHINTGPHKVRFPDSTGDIWQDYFPHLWQLNFLSNRIFNGWHFLQCIIKGKNRNTIYALVLSNKINSLQNMLGRNIFAYSCQS